MANLVVLSIGSNMDDRGENIKKAVDALRKKFSEKFKVSPVYDTPPLYYEYQHNFYNCCVSFKSDYSVRKIFEITSSIENALERKRGNRHGPRIIDIDILYAGDQIITNNNLTVPHPGIQERLFVLEPLSDILPDLVHPALQLTTEEMLDECPDESVIKKIRGFWKEK